MRKESRERTPKGMLERIIKQNGGGAHRDKKKDYRRRAKHRLTENYKNNSPLYQDFKQSLKSCRDLFFKIKPTNLYSGKSVSKLILSFLNTRKIGVPVAHHWLVSCRHTPIIQSPQGASPLCHGSGMDGVAPKEV